MATSDRTAVVIGAGITGTLLARELTMNGWSVTLVEAAHVGAGSSSRTAAGIRQQFSTPGTVLGMRYSIRFYKRFAEETEDRRSPLIQNGYLFLFADEAARKAAHQRVAMQHAVGLTEVELLEGTALTERFEWTDPEVCLGGTWCPTDGFLLPELIYNEAARVARERGARLVQHAPVTSVVCSGDRVVAVETPKGRFEADLFFDCTNAWSPRVSRLLQATELPIQPRKRYLWFLARDGSMSADTMARMPLTISPTGVYCRPENRETLLMGRAHPTPPEFDFSYDDQDRVEPAFAHNTGLDTAPFAAWMDLAAAVPPIGEFGGITATTSGYYATTPDHNPFFGFDPARANLVRLVGFSGHGAMFGPFSARVGAALADAGHDLDAIEVEGDRIDLTAFRIGRPFEHAEKMVI